MFKIVPKQPSVFFYSEIQNLENSTQTLPFNYQLPVIILQ